jgi:hypothetical protein
LDAIEKPRNGAPGTTLRGELIGKRGQHLRLRPIGASSRPFSYALVLISALGSPSFSQDAAVMAPPAGFIAPKPEGRSGVICSECGMQFRAGYLSPRAGVPALSQDERAVIAILSDESLQPGDLVMFPDGLKVFQGGSPPHTADRFRHVEAPARRSIPPRQVPKASARPRN